MGRWPMWYGVCSWRRGRGVGRRAVPVWLSIAVLALVFAPQALASPFTWTGASTTTARWSSAANWGGSAPTGGSSAELVFPHLTQAACGKETHSEACYASRNDLTGLTAESLRLDDGDPYLIWGERVALGSSGLEAAPASGSSGPAGAWVLLPVSFSTPQTWSVAGRSGGAVGENGLILAGGVSGSGNALTVSLSEGPLFFLAEDTEVGPLKIQGTSGTVPGYRNGVAGLLGGSMNAADGEPVALEHIDFEGVGLSGPLTSTASEVYVPVIPRKNEPSIGKLEAMSATFDANSVLGFQVDGSGTVAGSDYGQLSSSGPIQLGGKLVVYASPPAEGQPCPRLSPGAQYTLISTTGALTGEFQNAPEGSEILIEFAEGCPQEIEFVKVAYNRTGSTHSVTATVIAGPSSTTTLSELPANAVTDQIVPVTAKVSTTSGYPSGTVAFDDSGTPIPGCESVSLAGMNTATCRTSFAADTSPEHLSATFTPGPGVNLKGSASGAYELAIAKGQTSTNLQASETTPMLGASVTFTASVYPAWQGTASKPSGAVQFRDGETPIASCANVPLSTAASMTPSASCQASYAAAGTHSITAVYLGDANFEGSPVSAPQTVTVQGLLASIETHEPEGHRSTASLASLATGQRIAVRAGSARVKLACSGPGSCAGMLLIQVRRATKRRHRRPGTRMLTIGSTNFSIANGTTSIAVPLNGAGRRLLRDHHGRLAASLRLEQPSGTPKVKSVHMASKTPPSGGHRHRK